MAINAISNARTVPVTEDLTTDELRLSVLRGLESMFRVDKKNANGAAFALGEWAVLNANGELERASASSVANTYPVFAGTDRFDAEATGQSTIIMGGPIIARTSQYNDALSYNIGDTLTVKNLGGGESRLTKTATGDVILARVVGVGSGYIDYEYTTVSGVAP